MRDHVGFPAQPPYLLSVSPRALARLKAGQSYVLHRATETVNITNAAQGTLYDVRLEGGLFVPPRALRFSMIGDYLNNSGVNRIFLVALQYGVSPDTRLLTSGSVTIATSPDRRALLIHAEIQATGQRAMALKGAFVIGAPDATPTGSCLAPLFHGIGFQDTVLPTFPAPDMTVEQPLQVIVQHTDGPEATTSARLFSARLELLP